MITRAVLFERFLGREAELRFLVDARAECARSGRGGVVLVSGEAGFGKSRLIAEFQKAANAERGAFVRTACDEIGTPPYGPFASALRDLGGRRELKGRPAFDAACEALESDAADGLPAAERRLRRHGALARGLEDAAARLGHLTLVFEDVHWSDLGSLEALSAVAAGTRRAPLLVLATYRSDDLRDDVARAAALGRIEREGADRIRLGPLEDGLLLAALRAVVGGESPKTLRDICELAEGKPYVAEELARNVVERGTSGPLEAPRSLRGAVLERAERLAPEDRDILARAAVCGRAMRFADGDVLGSPPERVRRAVSAACELQLLEETEIEGEPAFRFRHALTREILYRETLALERRSIHRAIAEALETRAAARPGDLAYHWWAAGEPEPTLKWNERAAEAALGVAALADACESFERALGPARANPAALGRIALKAANTLRELGRFDESIAVARDAAPAVDAAGLHEDAQRLRLAILRANCDAYRLSAAREALAVVHEGETPATPLDVRFDRELYEAILRAQELRYPEAFAALERGRAYAQRLGDFAELRLLNIEANLHLRRQDVDRAEPLLRRAIELTTSPANASHRSNALLNLGGIAFLRGSPAGVIAWAEQALEIVECSGAELGQFRARAIIAQASVELGDLPRARTLLAGARRAEATFFPTWIAVELFLARAAGDPIERLEAIVARAEATLPDTYLIKEVIRHAPWMLEPGAARDLIGRLLERIPDDDISLPVAYASAALGDDAALARVKAARANATLGTAFDVARDRMFAARVALRESQPLAAGEAALAALPFLRAAGLWLLEAHAHAIAGAPERAREIFERVGASAELARLTPAPAVAPRPPAPLSPREAEIATLIAMGLSNREVAERLSIGTRTVETHLTNIYDKLGVRSRAELALHLR